MTPPSVVLFDLDGTLSDSAPGIIAALRHAFAVNGLAPLDERSERALLGPPFYESLPPLIGADAVPAVIAAYRSFYGAGAMYDTTLFPGVGAVLTALSRAGVRLAVATSKPEAYALPIVERLGVRELFDTVAGDDLDGSLRTKALVIGKVLARLGFPDPGAIVMVGDRAHDVEGARAHGIETVAVSWGYAMPGELAAARPAAICADALELAAVLGVERIDAEAT
jgi:phosphoglycolate phosphatase